MKVFLLKTHVLFVDLTVAGKALELFLEAIVVRVVM